MRALLKVLALLVLLLPYRTTTLAAFFFTPDYSHQGFVAESIAFWVLCWFVIAGPAGPAVDVLFDRHNWAKAFQLR